LTELNDKLDLAYRQAGLPAGRQELEIKN